jgi:hypothetical protein
MAVPEVEAIGSLSQTNSQQLRYLELKYREKGGECPEAQGLPPSGQKAQAVQGASNVKSLPITGYDSSSRLKSDLSQMLGLLQGYGQQGEANLADLSGASPREATSSLAKSLISLLHFVHSGDVGKAQEQAAALQGDLQSMLADGEKDIKQSGGSNSGAPSDGAVKYQLQKDLMAMMNAVRVGDLSGAKSALEMYEQHVQTLKEQGGHAGAQFVSALQTLLHAVQLGNTSTARTAAQALFVSDLQALLRAASGNDQKDPTDAIVGPKPMEQSQLDIAGQHQTAPTTDNGRGC